MRGERGHPVPCLPGCSCSGAPSPGQMQCAHLDGGKPCTCGGLYFLHRPASTDAKETPEEMAARTGLPVELLTAQVVFHPTPADVRDDESERRLDALIAVRAERDALRGTLRRVRELAETWERRAKTYGEHGDRVAATDLRQRATALRTALGEVSAGG